MSTILSLRVASFFYLFYFIFSFLPLFFLFSRLWLCCFLEQSQKLHAIFLFPLVIVYCLPHPPFVFPPPPCLNMPPFTCPHAPAHPPAIYPATLSSFRNHPKWIRETDSDVCRSHGWKLVLLWFTQWLLQIRKQETKVLGSWYNDWVYLFPPNGVIMNMWAEQTDPVLHVEDTEAEQSRVESVCPSSDTFLCICSWTGFYTVHWCKVVKKLPLISFFVLFVLFSRHYKNTEGALFFFSNHGSFYFDYYNFF